MKKQSDLFRQKIANGQRCFGMMLTLTDSIVAEVAGELGFDFVWIDAEHIGFNPETISRHIGTLRGFDCAPFVRVQWNEWGVIKPILDMAPAGVIIPMVNSADEAEAAVASCRYPTRGIRGCGPRRGNHFGLMNFNEYLEDSQNDPIVILQIEHINALGELDRILEVPGIDSICIGPADFSGSLGKFCQFEDPEVIRCLDEIAAKVKKHGLMLGTADAYTPRWKARGVDWIACTGDLGMIVGNGKRFLEKVREQPQ